MEKQKTIVPWFRRGDIGGMSYSITNNIVNYLIVIATLSGVLGWPDKQRISHVFCKGFTGKRSPYSSDIKKYS